MNYTTYLFAHPSFFEGMGRLLDFGNTLSEYNRVLSGEQADQFGLSADMLALGDDLSVVCECKARKSKDKSKCHADRNVVGPNSDASERYILNGFHPDGIAKVDVHNPRSWDIVTDGSNEDDLSAPRRTGRFTPTAYDFINQKAPPGETRYVDSNTARPLE
jgi:hypothetical protein